MKPLAIEIEESIAAGKGNAVLCESIEIAKGELMDAGWDWNPDTNQMERNGWRVWFRGQGALSRPIAQWSRIAP